MANRAAGQSTTVAQATDHRARDRAAHQASDPPAPTDLYRTGGDLATAGPGLPITSGAPPASTLAQEVWLALWGWCGAVPGL